MSTLPRGATVRRDAGIYGYERALRRHGLEPVAGVDEAGRGACAGPLVAGAAILPPGKAGIVPGLADSKLLTAPARERCYDEIIKRAGGLSDATIHRLARPIPAMRVETVRGTTFRLTYGDADRLVKTAVGFDRSALDPALLDVARGAGADVRTGEAVTSVGHGSVRLVGGEVIRARVVVGADGLRSAVVPSGTRERFTHKICLRKKGFGNLKTSIVRVCETRSIAVLGVDLQALVQALLDDLPKPFLTWQIVKPMEDRGLEPLTSCMPCKRSPN